MDLLDYLLRQFTYNAWANREVFTHIGADAMSTRPLQLLSHIVSAERLWLERIRQQPQSLAVWPNLTLEECGRQLDYMPPLWRDYLKSAPLLAEKITYKNTRGEPWTSSVEDILTHVLLHSAYHRGQIASQIRADGFQPAYTDFIHAVRNGRIE
jgi:uncharacterized damage-inducible protein DinB